MRESTELLLTRCRTFVDWFDDEAVRGLLGEPRRLRYAIAFALRRARKVVRGLKERLSESERYAVADHVVRQLKGRGDPWRLGEEAKPAPPPSTSVCVSASARSFVAAAKRASV